MNMKKTKFENTNVILSQDEYVIRFAMMLRCSITSSFQWYKYGKAS